jgi:DNA-binding MarR family transcriptional regulator
MSQQRQGGFLISKVHRTAGRIFARLLREHGLEINPAQGRVLFILWEEGSMTIHELARKASLGKSTLTSTLDRLEAAGQVQRVASPEDKRKTYVQLTPKNKTLHKIYQELSERMTKIFYKGFAEAEIDVFEQALERILKNLTRAEV